VFARVDKSVLGAFAEFAVVREDLVVKMPSTIDFATAAVVPLAGLTALQALRDELRVVSGQNIFISGGSGSELATLIDQQKLQVVIDRSYPFAQITDAFAYLEQGHAKGKVVVPMVE
jgi:NADPH:quinone reductase-like Zn-dependent oxidoreductase